MIARACAVLAMLGCTSRINPEYCRTHPEDVATCGASDTGTSELCLGSGAFTVCVEAPTIPATVATDLDTDIAGDCLQSQPAMWKAAGQPDACFVVGTTVRLDMLRAHGGRPLVAFASDSITVTGLDVSSKRSTTAAGAGFDQTECAAGTPPMSDPTNGSGGGAGGVFFGAAAGRGGHGNGPNVAGGSPGTPLTAPPALLRGGCPGQVGGVGLNAGGPGGIGGGVVYLLATNRIDLTNATINASGAGGDPGQRTAGGGGGGSGGMIVLYAGMIGTTNAALLANGGGGGGGGAGGAGSPGSDPDPAQVMMPASGGAGASQGAGGSGFAGASNAQNGIDGSGGAGGGGGGGGGGLILTNHTLGTLVVSPTPVTM